ncbi:lipopolysaccharide biosynthesis protein [Microbacterium sp. 22242]|uniref:lipopolysaccharide biosynthesis protein n=1 Tax=Microbacterium sp. 22242 TaxID=3453896 RepID=UPI003F859B83
MRQAFRHDLVRRSLLFSLSIVLSTVVGIFSIPVLISSIGSGSWGRLAVLQAITQFLGVIVGFGWGATGPSSVAALPRSARNTFFATSVRARLLLFLPVLIVGSLLSVVIARTSPLVAVLSAITYVVPALGAAWYFIGTNRPVALFLFDALPAILGQVAGLIWVLVSPSLENYLTATAAAACLGVVASWLFVRSRRDDGEWRIDRSRSVRDLLHEQWPGVTAMLTASVSSSLPIVIVSIFAPHAVALYAIIDRLSRYAVLVLAPILQAIQGWVPEAGRDSIPHRGRTAIYISIAIGGIGGLLMAVFAPWVSSLLTYGQAAVSLLLAVTMGIGFAAEAAGQIVGLAVLVAVRRSHALALSAGVATVAGMTLVLVGTITVGIPGTVSAIALTAVGVAVYRITVAWRRTQGHPASSTAS